MPLDPAHVPEELRGLRVAILVAGGIAAYKVVDLASSLTQAGCDVRVAMTPAATRFVGPPSFQGVTGNSVLTGLWPASGDPEPHVFLGDWAQLSLVAPATANVISRIAAGRSDDIVTATVLAARGPVVIAPAMNEAMWGKTSVRDNLAVLHHLGFAIAEPESGHLASGHVGVGRLASSARIFAAMVEAARARYDMAGRRVIVTAGGTREPIDPVRFISNYSSGKMGFALAAAAADRGSKVILVTAAAQPPHPGVEIVAVETAADMQAQLAEAAPGADLLIMAAAVADFRPARASGEKIRREATAHLTIELEPIPDILVGLAGRRSMGRPYLVGFAAEDSGVEGRAAEKLKKKRLDAIVANDISRRDIGFASDHNAGVVLFGDGSRHELERMTKREMADRILDLVVPRLPAQT